MLDKVTSEMFNKVMDCFFYVFKSMLVYINNYSFYVGVLVGLVALILYAYGYKKGKRIAMLSPAVYVLLQLFLEVWFGV